MNTKDEYNQTAVVDFTAVMHQFAHTIRSFKMTKVRQTMTVEVATARAAATAKFSLATSEALIIKPTVLNELCTFICLNLRDDETTFTHVALIHPPPAPYARGG